MKQIILFLMALCFSVSTAHAAKANQTPFTVRQADGSTRSTRALAKPRFTAC